MGVDDLSVEALNSLHGTHDARSLTERHDQEQTSSGALVRTYPVQRESAEEELQIAGFELQGANRSEVSVEHTVHGIVALVVGRSKPRRILEFATSLSWLQQHGDREFIGVEVPIELLARRLHVDDHVRDRVVVDEELIFPETSRQELHQRRPVIQLPRCRCLIPLICANKAICSGHKSISRVSLSKAGITTIEMNVCFFDVVVKRKVLTFLSFGEQRC